MIGQTINNYLLERKLGEGGMSEVFLARHNRIDRVVAIKILHKNLFANELVRNRFKNEANALIKLEHPNIVKIYDYIEQADFACLIVEFIDGITLDEYINKFSGPLPDAKASLIICTVLDAVQYAHDNGILHRDLKPGNIMVSRDGKIVKVMDFGIAKFTGISTPNVTHINTQLGTPFYMSPEQVKGLPYSAQSDIYSIGVTLFEMATGKCPYTGVTTLFELHTKIVNEPLPPTSLYYPDVSPKLQQAIKIATGKSPEERFKSCREFTGFLQEVNQPETVPARKDGPRPNNGIGSSKTGAAIPVKKSRRVYWVALCLLVIAAVIFSFIINKNSNTKANTVKQPDLRMTDSNKISATPPVKNDSLDLYKKADSIIEERERLTRSALTDAGKRNALKETLLILLRNPFRQVAVDSILKKYDPWFVHPQAPVAEAATAPDPARVKRDLANSRLSNGLKFETAEVISYAAGKPTDRFNAILVFKTGSNDTVYQVSANYKKAGDKYIYDGNSCRVLSMPPPPPPVRKGLEEPADADILDAARKNYLKLGASFCGRKYEDPSNVSDLKIDNRGTDVGGFVSYKVVFIIKGVKCGCKVQYRLNDQGNAYLFNKISMQ